MRVRIRMLTALVAGIAATSAVARDLEPGEMVSARDPGGHEPVGLRLGPFRGYLSAGLRETYDDNIFAESGDGVADYVTTVRPEIRLDGQWRRHDLNVTAAGSQTLHAANPAENTTDFELAVDARLDVGRDAALTGALFLRREHEPRSSPDEPGGEEPTPIHRRGARIVARQGFGRLGLRFAASYEDLDFGDVPARGGGEIENDDRDRRVARAAGRVSYGLTPTIEPFVEVAADAQRYDKARDDNGFDRDADAFEIAVGGRYRRSVGGLLEARVGLRRQRVDDPALGEITGAVAELVGVQRLSPLTSLRLSLSRELQQSAVAGAAGFFATRAALRLEHELRRDLLLGADAAFAVDTFTGIGREDRTFAAGADARYRAGRHLDLTLDYGFSRRLSTADADFARNRVTLGARVSY